MSNNEEFRRILNILNEGLNANVTMPIKLEKVLLRESDLPYAVPTKLRGIEFSVKDRNKLRFVKEFTASISGRGYQEIEFEPGLNVNVMGLFVHAFCDPTDNKEHGHIKLFFNLSGDAVNPDTYKTVLKEYEYRFVLLINYMIKSTGLTFDPKETKPYQGADGNEFVKGKLNDALKIDMVNVDLGNQLMDYCQNGLVK